MADPDSRHAARTATLAAVPVALLAGVLAFALLGGFGGGTPSASGSATPQPSSTVSVPAQSLSRHAETVCRGFIATLPLTIRGERQRPVSTGPEQNAAFGAPPIVVRCGVPAATVPKTATVYRLGGVCYLATRQPTGTVWTTVDRTVPVAVTVPKQRTSPGQWTAEFSDSIAGAVPSLDKAPTGCGE